MLNTLEVQIGKHEANEKITCSLGTQRWEHAGCLECCWLLLQQQWLRSHCGLVLLGSSCKDFGTEKPGCSRYGSELHSPQHERCPNIPGKRAQTWQHIYFAFPTWTFWGVFCLLMTPGVILNTHKPPQKCSFKWFIHDFPGPQEGAESPELHQPPCPWQPRPFPVKLGTSCSTGARLTPQFPVLPCSSPRFSWSAELKLV